MGKQPKDQIPDPPMDFITLRWDDDGDLILDMGDLNHYEAWGLLAAALKEVEESSPPVVVRYNGEFISPWLDDDEED